MPTTPTTPASEGDVVRVAEIAPMSKTKNWRVVEIVTRAAE